MTFRVVGCDVGTRNFGICMLEFGGYADYDSSDEDQEAEIFSEKFPRNLVLDVLHWELWDLKTDDYESITAKEHACDGFCSCAIGDQSRDENQFPEWRNRLARRIGETDWLFEEYVCYDNHSELPVVAAENQMDHIKRSGRNDNTQTQMYTLGNVFMGTVRGIDHAKLGRSDRLIVNRSSKFGLPQRTQDSYSARKTESYRITCGVLLANGMHAALKTLNSHKKRDDKCDAFLIALKEAIEIHKLFMKHAGLTMKKPMSLAKAPTTKTRKRNAKRKTSTNEESDAKRKKVQVEIPGFASTLTLSIFNKQMELDHELIDLTRNK